MHVKPRTTPRERYEWTWELMQSAGPQTAVNDFSYFDIRKMPERQLGAVAIQALVNHVEDAGQSMLMNRHAPGAVQRVHSHDVDQILVVLDGTLWQGNRSFPPGAGFFTPKGKRYGFRADRDSEVLRVEWRPSPLRFATDYGDDESAVRERATRA
jgi:hypothetical protein